MTETRKSKSADERKAIRPILIASQRTVTEQAAFLRRLLVGLADASISPAVVCPPGCEREGLVPVPAEVLVHPAVDLPVLSALGFESLAARLERFRPTVIHCLCESRAALAARLARRLDVPYVLAVNGLATKRPRLSISSEHCARIVVPAQTIGDSIAATQPQLADRITPIHIGAFVEPEPGCFSNPGHLTSMIVAEPIKPLDGHVNLFGAVKALVAEGYEFMTVVFGGGRVEHALRGMLAEAGLGPVVTIIPPLEPWHAVLAAGDIYVQPQVQETFSSRLLEAMSVGTAVAACPGGVDDLIVDNETALVFDPDDAGRIKGVLKQLLDNHDFARRLARRALSHLKEYYSVAAMVSATLETYAQSQRQYNHAAAPPAGKVVAS